MKAAIYFCLALCVLQIFAGQTKTCANTGQICHSTVKLLSRCLEFRNYPGSNSCGYPCDGIIGCKRMLKSHAHCLVWTCEAMSLRPSSPTTKVVPHTLSSSTLMIPEKEIVEAGGNLDAAMQMQTDEKTQNKTPQKMKKENGKGQSKKPKIDKEPKKPKIVKETKRPKLDKEKKKPKLDKKSKKPKLDKKTKKPKLDKKTNKPKLGKKPKLAKKTNKPKLDKETSKPKLDKKTEKPKIERKQEKTIIEAKTFKRNNPSKLIKHEEDKPIGRSLTPSTDKKSSSQASIQPGNESATRNKEKVLTSFHEITQAKVRVTSKAVTELMHFYVGDKQTKVTKKNIDQSLPDITYACSNTSVTKQSETKKHPPKPSHNNESIMKRKTNVGANDPESEHLHGLGITKSTENLKLQAKKEHVRDEINHILIVQVQKLVEMNRIQAKLRGKKERKNRRQEMLKINEHDNENEQKRTALKMIDYFLMLVCFISALLISYSLLELYIDFRMDLLKNVDGK